MEPNIHQPDLLWVENRTKRGQMGLWCWPFRRRLPHSPHSRGLWDPGELHSCPQKICLVDLGNPLGPSSVNPARWVFFVFIMQVADLSFDC